MAARLLSRDLLDVITFVICVRLHIWTGLDPCGGSPRARGKRVATPRIDIEPSLGFDFVGNFIPEKSSRWA